MNNLEENSYNDIDMVSVAAYWEKIKQRMEGCRKLALEFIENYDKPKSYLFKYSCDIGDESIYTEIDKADCEKIKAEYESVRKFIEKEGFDNSEIDFFDVLSDSLPELDIDWEYYVPEYDRYWIGGPAMPLYVDFEDYRLLYRFNVLFYKNQDSEPQLFTLVRELNKDQVVELLAFKLFDPELALDDVSKLDEELYKLITNGVYRIHYHNMIFFTEIEEYVKKIIEKEEYKALPSVTDHPVVDCVLNEFYSRKEEFGNDIQLMNAFTIANKGTDIRYKVRLGL